MMRTAGSFSSSTDRSFGSSSGSSSGAVASPYMRTYATTRGYSPIGGGEGDREEQRGNGEPGAAAGGGRGGAYLSRRVVGAFAVCLGLAAAVSTSSHYYNGRIALGSDQRPRPQQSGGGDDGGNSYRAELEALNVSELTALL